MAGLLLDTHSLLWSANGDFVRPSAATSILQAAAGLQLFTSAMCVWELGVAARKNHPLRRPDLRGLTHSAWFDMAIRSLSCGVLPITADIAAEAADVAPVFGSGDPGDCFVIATARIHNLALVSRDTRILAMAANNPAYLSVVAC